MSYNEDVVKLVNLIKSANELVTKIINENSFNDPYVAAMNPEYEPAEKFRLLVTSDNLTSMFGRLTRDFASKL